MRISKKIATAAAALALAAGLLAPFQGGTVSPPDDPAKCRRAKGSDSSLNGISPHR